MLQRITGFAITGHCTTSGKKTANVQEIFVIFPLDNNEVAPMTDLGDYVFACQLMRILK